MRDTKTRLAVLCAATGGLLALSSTPAGAQAGRGSTFHFSQFALEIPPIPGGPCSDLGGDWIVWPSGHGVGHDEANNNGDWGGGTMTGPAQLWTSDGLAQLDQGLATGWEGGGNNAAGQFEMGITIDFRGDSSSFHLGLHVTTNNAGTPTAVVDSAHC